MAITIYPAGGIEIDHGGRDISAGAHDQIIEIAIGINYRNKIGYESYSDINLNLEEATALRDWLTTKLPA